jgi:hypothetical protein
MKRIRNATSWNLEIIVWTIVKACHFGGRVPQDLEPSRDMEAQGLLFPRTNQVYAAKNFNCMFSSIHDTGTACGAYWMRIPASIPEFSFRNFIDIHQIGQGTDVVRDLRKKHCWRPRQQFLCWHSRGLQLAQEIHMIPKDQFSVQEENGLWFLQGSHSFYIRVWQLSGFHLRLYLWFTSGNFGQKMQADR